MSETNGGGTTTTSAVGSITLIAKWSKERITLSCLTPETTIGAVKEMLKERTGVLPKRQKLIGLTLSAKGQLTDQVVLSELKVKKSKASSGKTNGDATEVVHEFILMGTPEEKIFVDPIHRDDLPDVIDDFDLDFNAGSEQWLQHVANGDNLKKFTEQTQIHIMNDPRPGKPLLVLDLDHTLLDFSSKILQRDTSNATNRGRSNDTIANAMKRPYMDQFLTAVYPHYDLCVWSQTSWRWLETKLIELGMLANPGYKFCFVLDKTSMFTVVSTRRDGSSVKHHVKPLQLIWSKFADRWSNKNTVHIDDLGRNFALNLGSGIKISAYYRKKSSARRDAELLGLGKYLEELATSQLDFDQVEFDFWQEVVSGKRSLTDKKK